MDRYVAIKNEIILILLSLSIFLSFTSISFLEVRFLYLLIFFFLIHDSIYLKKISLTSIIIATSIIIVLFCYSHLFNFFFFKSGKFLNFSIYQFKENNILKLLVQSFLVGISVLIILFYKDLLISNLVKIIDYFVILFVSLILFYNLKHSGILFDLLYRCDLGFFYYTKFLFKETSHFLIISVPVITSFIYNIKVYLRKKIICTFYILFIIFSFGNFSLTFYLSIMAGIFIVFISCKNIDKLSKYLFLILLILSNFLFFYKSQAPNIAEGDTKQAREYYTSKRLITKNCTSAMIKKIRNDQLGKEHLWLRGPVTSGPAKLKEFFKKDSNNMSAGVYVYSLYTAKVSILKYPFGVGLNNYINFRKDLDQMHKINWEEKVMGEIKFEEKYMPTLTGVILDLNLHSGSNNFSKLIVEFGLFGLFILLLIFIYSFSNKIHDTNKVILLPLIFIQVFIRGTGYFNSGFLISLIIILVLIISPTMKKDNYEIKNFK